MSIYKFSRSIELFDRATKIIPGGIYGHQSPALTVLGSFPYYVTKADGCRYWDVDGQEYIDYMCAYGPMVLGYNYPKVEDVVEKQRKLGDCFNHPTELMVELAEYLIEIIPVAQWVVFAKNGSDLTTWALQVAREHTGRKKIIMVSGTYHGTHAWCSPGVG